MFLTKEKPKVGLLITALLEDDWNKTGYLRPKAQASVQNFVNALAPFCDVVSPGLVETEADAMQADLAFKAAQVDAVVFVELAYTQSIIPLRCLLNTQVPILIWNTQQLTHWPEDADWDLVMLNSGLAGLPETTHALTRAGRKFLVVTGHLKDPKSLARLEEYVRMAGLVKKLQLARIGMVGHPYQYMVDLMIDPFKLRTCIGPTLVQVDLDEVASAVAISTDAEVDDLIAEAQKLWRTDELEAKIFRLSARYAAGLDKVVAARQLDALAYFDQGLLNDPRVGVVPSWGQCRLIARGIPVTAEADLNTAAGMLILQDLAGDATFVENYGFDFDAGAAYIAHDSIGNTNMASADPQPALRHSIYYKGCYGMGAAMEFAYKPGPVTFLALINTASGNYKILAGEGHALPFRPRPTVAPQMLWKPAETSLEMFYDQWTLQGAGHHSAIAYGHLGHSLKILAEMLGVEYCLIR
jgi:L-arabinose isomerase